MHPIPNGFVEVGWDEVMVEGDMFFYRDREMKDALSGSSFGKTPHQRWDYGYSKETFSSDYAVIRPGNLKLALNKFHSTPIPLP